MTIVIKVQVKVPNDKKYYSVKCGDKEDMEKEFCRRYGFDTVPAGTEFGNCDDVDMKEIYERTERRLMGR